MTEEDVIRYVGYLNIFVPEVAQVYESLSRAWMVSLSDNEPMFERHDDTIRAIAHRSAVKMILD